jgi:hypothetical protein
MRDLVKIAKVVRDTLALDFEAARILDVRVREDFDFDGSEILRVDVLFEGTPKDLDAKKVSGTVRLVRPKLMKEANERAFPLFSFISKGDVGAERFEAA